MNQVKQAPGRSSRYTGKPIDLSSWIEDIRYRRFPDGRAYLGIFLRPEIGEGAEPVALLYGPEIPSWLPGLIQAGAGKRSVGRAYHRLVKGRFPFQRVTGAEAVALKEMLS